jgi:hypothetical protein
MSGVTPVPMHPHHDRSWLPVYNHRLTLVSQFRPSYRGRAYEHQRPSPVHSIHTTRCNAITRAKPLLSAVRRSSPSRLGCRLCSCPSTTSTPSFSPMRRHRAGAIHSRAGPSCPLAPRSATRLDRESHTDMRAHEHAATHMPRWSRVGGRYPQRSISTAGGAPPALRT